MCKYIKEVLLRNILGGRKVKSRDTFAILHLSDLHIVAHNKEDYSIALRRMIDHIDKVTQNVEKIIIVFTGDLVEKGEFEKAKQAVYNFFTDLKIKLGNKVIDIVCTPGNHDKRRGHLVLGQDVKEGDENFWEKFAKEDWLYFENQFAEYKEMMAYIQKNIFFVSPQGDSTYGMRCVNVGDKYNICFLCFNSAWACTGKNDEGNLRIGQFQLDKLMSRYQRIKKNVDLVIGLMHHPTDWLTKTEQKYLNQYMTDEYRLNTNIMLQGHIHEKETCNWYNQNHSLTTLVTGMGWDQQKEINEGGHRYSIYRIDMESCIVKVNTYVTDTSGIFNEDTAVYNGENIIFPLFVHRFLELNNLRFKKSEIPFFYPNYNSAENLEQITDRLNDFSLALMGKVNDIQFEWLYYQSVAGVIKELFPQLTLLDMKKDVDQLLKDITEKNDTAINRILNKNSCIEEFGKLYHESKKHPPVQNVIEMRNILERLLESIRDNEEMDGGKKLQNHVWNFLEKDRKIYLKNKLYAFIGDFCMLLAARIFPQKEFKEGDTVRVHFRILTMNEEEEAVIYKKLFAYTITKENSKIRYMTEETGLTDIKYANSMIEKSFNSNKIMLCSLNPSSNNHVSKGKWRDFVTIAPNIDCNKYLLGDECEDAYYPYMSFGISITGEEHQKTLRGITYVNFDKILCRFLKKFCSIIPIDFEEIMKERG